MFPKSALIGVLAFCHPMPVHAHDIYANLMNFAGTNCCDNTDCRPAPYRLTPSGLLMQIDGNWIEVPSEVILYRALPGDDGRTGGGHWCGIYYEYLGMGLTTRCAVLPPNSALSTIGIPLKSR